MTISQVKYQDGASHDGDNNFYTLSSLESTIDQVKKSCLGHDELISIMEDLAEYLDDYPGREIIGLEGKLLRGDRSDLVERATRLKNKFARRVAKDQMSLVEQTVYIQILSAICSSWHQCIYPAIISGQSKVEIDRLVNIEIIQPVHKAIVRYDSLITTELVSGMLYFLTGLCHVSWGIKC
ncbi:Uncharacterised protein [Klebsiella pneumoniae]|uniref:ABC-three component system protein n=2 Tax=Klebsiella pneumoniae TaxID=573 RepID=UPI0003BE9600|nr:ABC-three component system protein [Klebsiella pneumoniae]EIV5396619.1 hypothetical protein [Klebsiella pneumoniae]EIV5542355.1 hypothetical protein [Klebsiella pneumoniae]EIX9260762.1 hypothetical protein [Klebsiella pneumoniae]EIX9402092.1 hypothetical protein [Klebsiella pneumoniae]EKV3259593.1 hypothetical protein [Klebsiella pneumoniae]